MDNFDSVVPWDTRRKCLEGCEGGIRAGDMDVEVTSLEVVRGAGSLSGDVGSSRGGPWKGLWLEKEEVSGNPQRTKQTTNVLSWSLEWTQVLVVNTMIVSGWLSREGIF